MQLHNKTFIDQFHNRVICEELKGVFETVKWLVFGSREDDNKYEGYDVYGFTFWTKGQDKKSSYLQNSGVLFWRHLYFTRVPNINRRLMLNQYATCGYMKYGSLTTLV